MAEPTGYAHAAALAGGADLAVRLAGELREAREALARVRALHRPRPVGLDGDVFCIECSSSFNDDGTWRLNGPGCMRRYPCATIAALDPPDGTS